MDRIELAGLIIALLTIITFFFFITEYSFPAFKYAVPSSKLIETTMSIGPEVSRFLWTYRAVDLIAQAFLLFATAAGCLALLRAEEKEETR